VNDLRLLGRVALGLALLALLAAALALHGLRAQRIAVQARLGATFAGAAGRTGGGHPVVTSLRHGGRAAAAGLAVGDVVEAVGGRATGSLAELDRAVASGAPAAMRVRRGAREIGVVVR
jgi:S1-C subfamily serine protease